jgi:hypothetical protein
MRRRYATQGAVQPGPVFMEDAIGNKYDMAGNIIPPADNVVNDALSVARREVDPYLKVPGHEHLTSVPPVTPPRPDYVPHEAIKTVTQPSRDVFWQGVEQFRNPQTEPRTLDRTWELLSGAGQIGLGALGTGMSGAIGAGVEYLPTWLTGPQNQRNKLAAELNEMTMFTDPILGPEALAATAPIQRVGGIRNATAIEGNLAKQRMADRGPSALYDPLRVSSGVDPTEAGKAVANAKDAAIAKIGETAENAALKAAQEATGEDQAALAVKTAQKPLPPPSIGHNVPPAKTLLETFDEENLPGVVVSPKPGTAGFTFSTPDIIGMPVPPPMYNPIRKADIRPIARDAEKILNSPGFRKYAEEQLGVSGFNVTPTVGTWMGNPEPSFIIQGGNITPENARKLTNALGFGFQQDAAVLTMHNPSISDGVPTMLMGTGQELTKADVNRIMKAAKTHGLDFTLTRDGRAVRFSHFDGPETLPQFADKIAAIAEEAKMPELLGVKTQGDLINADQYINGLVPEAPSGAGVEYGPGQSPDLLGGLVDTVLIPFSKSAAGQGYRLSPERLGQQYAIGPDIEARVAQGLTPRGDRSTVSLMEGKEKLPIKGTGARGEVVVDDVIDALSNRAARKGYIEPGDYSPKAMSAIAKTIADEVYHHVTTSGKSALGWYDATLKKAKGAYQRIFPELASDPQRNMLFDAILGITSQGADVYTNSQNAVRLYNLVRNGEMTLPQAVSKLSGTLGKETAAVEQNLLKLDELLGRNGYDRMADLFNQTKTVGEWNKIFRDDKSLHVRGKPFQIKGGKNQKVTGWMVFGPKIGSFINNLHGDYSTLTADLWFTRSWNRVLGNSFIHDPGTEAAQFRDFRDALKAEYAKTHDIRDPLMRQKYSPDVAGYSQKLVRGKQSGEPWEFGQDVASMSPEEFNALLNDPDAMLQYAYDMEQVYRKGGYKEKSDLRRRAKNWVEGRENAQADPRADLERAFQQDTIEQTQKLLKKRGLDISVADIQAALWYYEKELFGKYGVASEKSAPADYFDAAQKTLKRVDSGTLYENEAEATKRTKKEGASNKPISAKQAAKNFDAAFGQTYLKDPSGKPMRLYHMTPGDIREFSASPDNRSGPVVFLSPYADFQPAYHQAAERGPRGELTDTFKEGANVMPVYADVRSPLVLDHPRKVREAAAKYQGGDRNFPRIVTPEAKAAMEADGFDAIIFGGDNAIPYGDRPMDARLGHQEARNEEFIIFDPKKIKSAIGNRGTYDLSTGDINKAYGGALADDEDIDNALRLARAMGGRAGYAGAGSVPVMMEDAKGNRYDAQGNIIPPTNPGPNPARSDVTPQSVAAKAVNDPATYDALMERYAVPDRDIAEYEALRTAIAQQPQDIQQMTHLGDRPRRDVTVDMPLLGGEYKMGSAPYDVASGMSGAAQAAYDMKSVPLYFNPVTAPFAAGWDVAEGVASNDPLTASLAIGFGPGSRMAKMAGIGTSGYLIDPSEAEAGPERWFSKAMEVARALPMEKMTGQQALAMLRKGVSPEELRWTGADAFLPQQKQITKQDLVDYLAKNRVQTQDVVLGGSKPVRRDNVVPSETAIAPYKERWDELVAQNRALNEVMLLPPSKRDADIDDLLAQRNDIQYEMDQIHDKAVDATIEEMGGLGLPVRYGPGSSYGEKYMTRGGEGYQETLMQLPQRDDYTQYINKMRGEAYGKIYQSVIDDGGTERLAQSLARKTSHNMEPEEIANFLGKRDEFLKVFEEQKRRDFGYKSHHWEGYPNVLAHVRTQMLDVTPPGANRPYKAFNVDEAQSDWAKAGREKGFVTPEDEANYPMMSKQYDQLAAERRRLETDVRYGDDSLPETQAAVGKLADVSRQMEAIADKMATIRSGGAPVAPYVTGTQGWTDLSIKKSIDQALDAGADYFTYTPGKAQAQRYSLRNEVQGLSYDPDEKTLSFYPKDGRGWQDVPDAVPREDLKKYVGEEAAKKLLAQEPNALSGNQILEGIDLEFGGEGMIDYYDNIFKRRVEKVVKDATGKKVEWEVIPVNTADGPREQLGFRLTDDMKNARFSDFNKGGRVADPVVNKALALTSEY